MLLMIVWPILPRYGIFLIFLKKNTEKTLENNWCPIWDFRWYFLLISMEFFKKNIYWIRRRTRFLGWFQNSWRKFENPQFLEFWNKCAHQKYYITLHHIFYIIYHMFIHFEKKRAIRGESHFGIFSIFYGNSEIFEFYDLFWIVNW